MKERERITYRGSINGGLKFDNGIVGFTDSRTTNYTSGKILSYVDGAKKYKVLSPQSNLFYLRCGDYEINLHMVCRLKERISRVEDERPGVSRIVTFEEALSFIRVYMKAFVKVNPTNDRAFGGILIGGGPQKVYQACTVYVRGTCAYKAKYLTDSEPLMIGSGKGFGLSALTLPLDLKLEACTEAIRTVALQTYLNTTSVGGSTNVFCFLDGSDISSVPDLVLEPLELHVKKHEVERDKIILFLISENLVGKSIEVEDAFDKWPEVLATSRVTSMKGYNLYRLYCTSAETTLKVFESMVKQQAPYQTMREAGIHGGFEFVTCKIGGEEKNDYVAKCTQPLLRFLKVFKQKDKYKSVGGQTSS